MQTASLAKIATFYAIASAAGQFIFRPIDRHPVVRHPEAPLDVLEDRRMLASMAHALTKTGEASARTGFCHLVLRHKDAFRWQKYRFQKIVVFRISGRSYV